MIDVLRRLVCRLLDPAIVDRVIDPTMADTAWERDQLDRSGQKWRSRWIAVIGVTAIARIIATCLLAALVRGTGARLKHDDRALGRLLAFTAVFVTALTLALVWVPYRSLANRIVTADARLLLTLVPQAFCVALPFGFLVAAFVALRGRAEGLRVFRATICAALSFSVVTFLVVATVMPRTNQAFRTMISAAQSPDQPEPLKGPNEMTLRELSNRIATFEARPGLAPQVQQLRYAYQVRWSISLLPITLALFAFGVSALGRGCWTTAAGGIASVAGYWGALLLVDSHLPESVWTPNVIFGLIGAALSAKALTGQRPA